jgi:hypothetical protein
MLLKILGLIQSDRGEHPLQRFHRCRKGWILVHVDDPRHGIARRAQGLAEEAFGRRRVSLGGGEQKVNRLAYGSLWVPVAERNRFSPSARAGHLGFVASGPAPGFRPRGSPRTPRAT